MERSLRKGSRLSKAILAVLARKESIGLALVLGLVFGCLVLCAQSGQKNLNSPGTYTDTALGFSYTYPVQLIPNSGDFRRKLNPAPKGRAQGAVLFSAFETPSPGKAREGVVIMTEDAAPYGANSDARHCLHNATTILSRQGWSVLRQDTPETFDGQSFLRADYEHTNPLVFQSAVCTIRKESVLEFIFSAGSEEEIDQLFRSLDTIRFQDRIQKQTPN